jgi:hypothetical protein
MSMKFSPESFDQQEAGSRRNFLKNMGATILAGMLFGAGIKAEATEGHDHVYEQGIDKLKTLAEQGAKEHVVYYGVSKKGESKWIDTEQGARDGQISFEKIDSFRGCKELSVIHNHPTPEFSKPPSVEDMMAASALAEQYGHEISMRFKVVDSSGVWEYKVSPTSPIFNPYEKVRYKLWELQTEFYKDKQVREYCKKDPPIQAGEYMGVFRISEDLMQSALKGALGVDAKMLAEKIDKEAAPIGRRMAPLLDLDEKLAEPYGEDSHMHQTSGGHKHVSDAEMSILKKKHADLINEYVKQWGKEGAVITFTPHKNK